MINLNSKKGFTLLEIMLVVLIISITTGFAALYYQNSQVRADLNSQANILVSYLRLGQSNAVSGRITEHNAIHLNQDSYTLFSGTSYNPASNSNLTISLPSVIKIQNINLNGSGSDIIFTTPDGETDSYGSFQLFSSQIDKTITVNITDLGSIDY